MFTDTVILLLFQQLTHTQDLLLNLFFILI